MTIRFDEDLYVAGNIQSQSLAVPAGTVGDAGIAAGAGIQTGKMRHRHVTATPIAQWTFDTAATQHPLPIRLIYGATAEIVDFAVIVAGRLTSPDAVTFMLLKNGVTITAAATVLDSSLATGTVIRPTLTDATAVAGDYFELWLTSISLSDALWDVLVQTIIDEDPI
jgi:hypothetical protein